MSYKDEFIQFMIGAGVLTFGQFITKSGRETPYFINTGNYRTGSQISALGGFYSDCVIENMKKGTIKEDITALFGPAYKGIPIAVAASIAFAGKYGKEINYCFNRKEKKDHGEGGVMVGYPLKTGDSVLIMEDVITAGTAVRECLPILKAAGEISVEGLVISVDRMEKGTGEKTAVQEIYEEFGIKTYSIVTVTDIIQYLDQHQEMKIEDSIRKRMDRYFKAYCVNNR
ncbi:orotate phosphoribosyltransferase [Sinanaerobacter chloroacetimidivorans]|uniref:Orotate phosphoribosyltransferase n=1 Tax=Sinanaerobacter chloroacetimidivorans TaxID=2818044 RepID=A0A8J7W0Z7_9FIRM|nr:orotate phosphoribosyltransferase [Sinanaerobacter chloroacetimidivorans]MBR0598787.1 orotate phosphoribosyltransferase [Sinanaerobacter chloroacetimidivorans]